MATHNPDALAERLDFRVSPASADRLRELARQEEASVGVILRRAVRLYLTSVDRREQESAA